MSTFLAANGHLNVSEEVFRTTTEQSNAVELVDRYDRILGGIDDRSKARGGSSTQA